MSSYIFPLLFQLDTVFSHIKAAPFVNGFPVANRCYKHVSDMIYRCGAVDRSKHIKGVADYKP